MIPFKDVNRVEVIDGSGRAFTRYGVVDGVDVDLQDGGRTLKIFLSPQWRLDRNGGAVSDVSDVYPAEDPSGRQADGP